MKQGSNANILPQSRDFFLEVYFLLEISPQ